MVRESLKARGVQWEVVGVHCDCTGVGGGTSHDRDNLLVPCTDQEVVGDGKAISHSWSVSGRNIGPGLARMDSCYHREPLTALPAARRDGRVARMDRHGSEDTAMVVRGE